MTNMFGVKVFKYLVKIPAIIFIVGFVVLNQQDTQLRLSPLNDPIELPMWIMGLALFSVGFTVGALLLWLNSWPIRKELKITKKKLAEAEKDLGDVSDTLHDNQITELEKLN